MKQIEEIKLSGIDTNPGNPRQISKEKFERLVDSLLVFPKMLEMRPIVVDANFYALGGNMRTEALNKIASMSYKDVCSRLSTLSDFVKIPNNEQEVLLGYWNKWINNPVVPVVKAESLSEEEKRQFIIKDNLSYGEWDMDALANSWDVDELKDWGMDLPEDWSVSPNDFGDGFSLPSGNKSPFQQMTFTFADEQADLIRQVINEIKQTDSYKYAETFGNENANGNALSLIVRQWAEQRK